jgi:hypothetical protein
MAKPQGFKKKIMAKNLRSIFGNCQALKTKYKNAAWRDFAQHLYFFEQNCAGK